jgi:hypothetical protein
MVIGEFVPAPVTLDSGRGIRNRWPSAETANALDRPVWANLKTVYPESNRSRGTEDSNFDPVALIATENILPELFVSRYRSSLLSRRHREKFPPPARNRPFPRSWRKRLDIDLGPAGLIRCIGDPFSIR